MQRRRDKPLDKAKQTGTFHHAAHHGKRQKMFVRNFSAGLSLLLAANAHALQVTNCFERIVYQGGLYHLRCTHPAFSGIDFCVSVENPGWSVVEHSDVSGVKIYMAREGISVSAYAQTYGTKSFSRSYDSTPEIPICFAWNTGKDWYYGWVHAAKENGEAVIKESCVETIANRTLCYRHLEIRDGSELKSSRIGNVQWTYRMFDTSVTLGGGDSSHPAVARNTQGELTLPTMNFDVGPVTEIADHAFANCAGLTSVVIPDTTTRIGKYAFAGCSALKSVQLPASIETIDVKAFDGCPSLMSVSLSIDNGRARLVIPVEWLRQYPDFRSKFGSDVVCALLKPSGKLDGGGRPMSVWQDYVAGTDPTDLSSRLKTRITIEKGIPVVTSDPELPPTEKSQRQYRIHATIDLASGHWKDITHLSDAQRAAYRFFKISVDVK